MTYKIVSPSPDLKVDRKYGPEGSGARGLVLTERWWPSRVAGPAGLSRAGNTEADREDTTPVRKT